MPAIAKIFATFCDKPEIPPVTILNGNSLDVPGVMKDVKPKAKIKAAKAAKNKPLAWCKVAFK